MDREVFWHFFDGIGAGVAVALLSPVISRITAFFGEDRGQVGQVPPKKDHPATPIILIILAVIASQGLIWVHEGGLKEKKPTLRDRCIGGEWKACAVCGRTDMGSGWTTKDPRLLAEARECLVAGSTAQDPATVEVLTEFCNSLEGPDLLSRGNDGIDACYGYRRPKPH